MLEGELVVLLLSDGRVNGLCKELVIGHSAAMLPRLPNKVLWSGSITLEAQQNHVVRRRRQVDYVFSPSQSPN